MTNREKMRFHLQEAERFQRRVLGFEKAAEREAPGDTYAQSRLLKDRHDYRSAVGARDGHQQQAIMYGIAALVDRD